MSGKTPDARDFLVTRRAKIGPEQAGLTYYGGNRRVPGLRREEVAMLAGVSADYYTRLEKGNLAGVSDSVLDAVASALQLDEAERTYLFDLARTANASGRPGARAGQRRRPQRRVRPAVQQILDSMTTTAAFVRNGRLDILGTNLLSRALYSPAFDSPTRTSQVSPPNLARFGFLDPAARDFSPTTSSPATPRCRSCAPRQAATRTTAGSPTWSASCARAARTSVPDGPRTTSGCIAAAPSVFGTPSASSPWRSRRWTSAPTRA
jgi:transcriptional regulator with XRE-family HTH domain